MVEAVKQLCASASNSWVRRSWKREVAGLLLIVHTGCTLFLLMISGVERMTAASGIYGVWTALLYAFALGAFGLDALHKQGIPGGPPSIPAGVPR